MTLRKSAPVRAIVLGALTVPLFLISCTQTPPEGISEEEVRRLEPISDLLARSTYWDTCRLYEAGDLQRQFILAEALRCPQTDADRRLIATIKRSIERIEAGRDRYRHLTCGELIEQRKAPVRFDCALCQEFSRRWDAQRESAREGLRVAQDQVSRGEGCPPPP